MALTAKKISEVDEIDAIADGDYAPMIDVSAATPAAKGKRGTAAKFAAYILAKFPLPSQGIAEARAETTPRMWSAQRIGQAIAAAIAGLSSGAQHKWDATAAPVGSDDTTKGYSQGSLWRWSLRVWICLDATTNIAVWVELTESGGGMTNPMSAAGDIIIGGTDGAAERLAKGDDGKVLKLVSGSPAWADESGGGGGGAPGPLDAVTHVASRALGLADANRLHIHDGGEDAIELEIPQQSVVDWPDGTMLWFRQPFGGGTFEATDGSGVSGAAVAVANLETVALARIGIDTWTVLYRWSPGA